MDLECPQCNGLINVTEICPKCENIMEDQGRVEDFFDPYNPYLDREFVTMDRPDHQCIHVFSCPNCGYDSRIIVNQIPV